MNSVSSGPLLLRLRRAHMTPRWHAMSISVTPCSDLRLHRALSTSIGTIAGDPSTAATITMDRRTQTSYDKSITMRQRRQPVHPSNYRGLPWYLGSAVPIVYRPVLGAIESFSQRTHCSIATLASQRKGESCSHIRITATQRHQFSSSMPPPNPTKEKVSGTKEKDVRLEETNHNHKPTTTSIVDRMPLSVQPYMHLARLDKPIGTMLLLWPCYWSTAIAADPGHWPDPKLLGLFTIGSFVMRGAGCTINDMWDADFDRHVERTKSRPLASGELSMMQATAFLAAQLSVGLGVLLSLPHMDFCFMVGAASLPLVVAYPLMKRYTNWPQLVLGMTFNWGALMGWAATHGSLMDGLCIVGPLYASGVTWTLVYDTLYAHQDKRDDEKLGLKSTALYFGDEYTKPILYGFSALTVVNWMVAGYNAAGLGQVVVDDTTFVVAPLLFGLGCGLAGSHLMWQVYTADLENADNLARRFRSNNLVGGLVFGTIVASNLAL